MTVHTILQAVCLFIIYTVLTVVLPELVFHQKYKGRRTGERLMLDITVSNFYGYACLCRHYYSVPESI